MKSKWLEKLRADKRPHKFKPDARLEKQPKASVPGKRERKREKIRLLLLEGKGIRAVARITGAHKMTVSTVWYGLKETPLCACGQPANHRGFCSKRFNESFWRQLFHAIWTQKKNPELEESGRAKVKRNRRNNAFFHTMREEGRAKMNGGGGKYTVCGMVKSRGVQHCCVCLEKAGINDYYLSIGQQTPEHWMAWRFCWKCAHGPVAMALCADASPMSDFGDQVLLWKSDTPAGRKFRRMAANMAALLETEHKAIRAFLSVKNNKAAGKLQFLATATAITDASHKSNHPQ